MEKKTKHSYNNNKNQEIPSWVHSTELTSAFKDCQNHRKLGMTKKTVTDWGGMTTKYNMVS